MHLMIKRNLELDRLRAFAVIMTVFIHYIRVFFPWSITPDYKHGTTIFNILTNSWTGVDLFFVISGYIISKMIVQNIDRLQNSSQELAQYIKYFFIKRIFRIYPVAWMIFFLVLICSFLFNQSGSFSAPENTIEAGISIFTYSFNYFMGIGSYHGFTLTPYWSLSVEEQFYLILPIFLILVKTTKQRVLILLSLLLLITFIIRPYSSVTGLFFTHTRCDGLIYGCLIYFLMQQPWANNIFGNNPGNKYIRILATLVLVLILSTVPAIGFSNNVIIPLGCILSAILVFLAASESNIIISFPFIQPCLDYLGSRSYSLYIIHFPIFSITQEIMYRLSRAYGFPIDSHLSIYYTLIAFPLIAIGTEVLYRFVELPFIAKGRKLLQVDTTKVSFEKRSLSHAI